MSFSVTLCIIVNIQASYQLALSNYNNCHNHLGVYMVCVEQKGNKIIDIQQTLAKDYTRETSIELLFPKNFEIDDDSRFVNGFDSFITQSRRFHKGNSISTMLLYVKQLEKKDLPFEKFSISISLFAFLFNGQLKSSSINETEEDSLENFDNSIDSLKTLLNSFRDFPIEDETKFEKFRSVDFVLSFKFEQFLLKNLLTLQSIKDSQDLRAKVNNLCLEEQKHRKDKMYHEKVGSMDLKTEDVDKITRLTNKMEMQERITELPLKLNTTTTNVGTKEKYLAIALSTGIIMILFGFIMLQLRLMGFDTGLQFVLGFAFLYVIRDVFKESIKSRIYKKIMEHKPRQKAILHYPGQTKPIGYSQTWWSEGLYRSDKKQRGDNSITIKERTTLKDFDYHGFKKIKTDLQIDLAEIMKTIPSDGREIYLYTANDKPSKTRVPRRIRVELKIHEKKTYKGHEETVTSRFRILIDRNKIIRIEPINY